MRKPSPPPAGQIQLLSADYVPGPVQEEIGIRDQGARLTPGLLSLCTCVDLKHLQMLWRLEENTWLALGVKSFDRSCGHSSQKAPQHINS